MKTWKLLMILCPMIILFALPATGERGSGQPFEMLSEKADRNYTAINSLPITNLSKWISPYWVAAPSHITWLRIVNPHESGSCGVTVRFFRDDGTELEDLCESISIDPREVSRLLITPQVVPSSHGWIEITSTGTVCPYGDMSDPEGTYVHQLTFYPVNIESNEQDAQ